ncbi:hypothetical protein GCM10010435_28080 [Winogradskya consettensis]|uniref:Uncharacterized protein n=1 Tax=Winogradskya consettensis TaxID=113560 RepID=A0A919SE86_9ACTN|nr:hypothetical protein [Actinoplanes consettensis]GIM71040.1 hypothetical protein Aco04nite_23430 [Actinoplanes consettensis]
MSPKITVRKTMSIISVIALILFAFTAFFSWRALGRADDALAQVNALASARAAETPPQVAADPTVATTTTDPPTSVASDDPTAEPAATVPSLDAQTQYKTRYTGQTLRIPPSCNSSVYIDLDEPRVQTESNVAELIYNNPCGVGTAQFSLRNDVTASAVPSEAVTPIECAEQIRTSPLGTADEPIRRGSVYCVKTSPNDAQATGITWKMVILAVTATAQDGTVTLKASAWDIPQ